MHETQCPDKRGGRRVALILQGGGALGAYQVGVFQALKEHDFTPDWLAGTSIGAINAALIAGNWPDDRMQRLEQFWREVAEFDYWNIGAIGADARQLYSAWSVMGAMLGGVNGFFTPRLSPLDWLAPGSATRASLYDTAPLHSRLQELIDFDCINNGPMRLTMGAVNIESGRLVNFDNRKQAIGVEHIMASGALPPGLPAVKVDGELYWDGGVYSNTPIAVVLDDLPRRDTLCFVVDLWNPRGREPRTLPEVMTRYKDLMYSTRSTDHIEHYRAVHDLRNAVRALYDMLPEKKRKSPECAALGAMGCTSTMNIVHLGYPERDWELTTKDVDFSWVRIRERWERGYHDALRAINKAAWMEPVSPETGVVIHQLPAKETG